MNNKDLTKVGFVEKTQKYKLTIPENVEYQIREWCNLNPSTEWSGILFYKTEGSFANEDIKFTAVDFFVLDIGTSGFTEFEITPEICNYMVENNLMDTHTGLLHSHNQMAAFFSGTDNTTLKEEGYDSCNFLSLVVNNAGNYVARVTNKITESFIGKREISYTSFDGKTITKQEDVKFDNNEIVEYYNLDIDIQRKYNSIKERVKLRFDELNKRVKKIQSQFNFMQNPIWGSDKINTNKPKGIEEKPKSIISTLFDKEDDKLTVLKPNDTEDCFHIDSIDAIEMMAQIIYGNITLTYDNFKKFTKVNSWIRTGMTETFDKRFHGSKNNREEALSSFSDFMFVFIDTILSDYYNDNYDYYTNLYPELADNNFDDNVDNETDFKCLISESILSEIEKLEKTAMKEGDFNNPYLESIKNILINNY